MLEKRVYGPNDQVNAAIIGMGIMGFNNALDLASGWSETGGCMYSIHRPSGSC